MATRKEFQLLQLKWDGPIGRNSVQGGTIVGDYLNLDGRVIVVKMPPKMKAPAKKAKKALPQTKQDMEMQRRLDAEHGMTQPMTQGV